MAKTVFILGAGASAQAGAPVMNDFLKVAQELHQAGKGTPEFDTVFRGVNALVRTHSKWPLCAENQNIETVFAAFEMAEMLGQFPGHSPEEIKELVPAVRKLINVTLDKKVSYPYPEETAMIFGDRNVTNSSYPDAPHPYPAFVQLVKSLREKATPRHSVAVITFNYDMAADYAFWQGGIPVDYALEKRGAGEIPLLKLHGSLNWGYCQECRSAAPWHLSDFFKKYHWSARSDIKSGSSVILNMSERIAEHKHCQELVNTGRSPVLVPPTWSKMGGYMEIASVWRAAAKELSSAKNVFVIGYSLPPTDMFFPYLFALGTAADSRLDRFWIFNPEPEIVTRFSPSLGPGSKPHFKFCQETFEEAIQKLQRVLLPK